MSWLDLPRVPEPEVMDDSAEVEAYASAAAQAYLDKIDDTFVAHAVRLVAGRAEGLALDIGTGPGQIVLKLARRLPGWRFIGVDRSPNMIRQALAGAQQASEGGRSFSSDLEELQSTRAVASKGSAVGGRSLSSDIVEQQRRASAPEASNAGPGLSAAQAGVQFFLADGNRLPFPDKNFDLVVCNSVLHHLGEPQRLLAEVARLVKPDGAILIRDLRRPSRLAFPFHVRWYGRHYSGLMYKLYCASVRSAYTVKELEILLRRSPLTSLPARADASSLVEAPPEQSRAVRVFTHGRTHLGLERGVS